MYKIIELKYVEEYKFWIRFNDGESRGIDFKNLIGKGISAKLLDIEYFKLAVVDEEPNFQSVIFTVEPPSNNSIPLHIA